MTTKQEILVASIPVLGENKLHSRPISSRKKKIALYTALWYFTSLISLWMNKFLLSSVFVNANVLSMAQLGMSVVCGKVWLDKKSRKSISQDHASLGAPQYTSKPAAFKDFSVLGTIRIINTVLGLIALKYVPVSFTETIKSSAPFFTVVLTYLILGQKTHFLVTLSLVPIILGLACSSFTEISFNYTGFIAAIVANCMDCVQNVLSKKYLTMSYTSSELQLYTSVFAAAIQLAMVCLDITINGNAVYEQHDGINQANLGFLLMIDGFIYYLQSIFAYMLMELISPLTHSVTNTVKRAFLIVLSVKYFGNQVTAMNWFGTCLILGGVVVYNQTNNMVTRRTTESYVDEVMVEKHAEISKIETIIV